MSRKKKEIVLQEHLSTQNDWNEMLSQKGLHIIDAYQTWCGPCKAIISNLKRIKNDIADDLLHYYLASVDKFDCLEEYKGQCEPLFLFFAGGQLVHQTRGANVPQLEKSIREQLAYEHKVIDGTFERKGIKNIESNDDRALSSINLDSKLNAISSGSSSDSVNTPSDVSKESLNSGKGITVAIIKPDLVQAEKVDEVIQKMKERGIEILQQEERQLTADEARDFYSHKKEEEHFNSLIDFMTSGPSVILVITKGETGETIIEEWRELLGPTLVEEAKENAPDSLRAQYGTEQYVNALHGSDCHETAARELAFFFPKFKVPTKCTSSTRRVESGSSSRATSRARVQRTLALIKPEALRERKDEIISKIRECGFRVAMQKEMHLSKEQAEQFYSEHNDQSYFDDLTTTMSDGPLLALALARDDAVMQWNEQLESSHSLISNNLPEDFPSEDVQINPLLKSDSLTDVDKQIHYVFGPVEQTIGVIKPTAFGTRDDIMNKVKEAGFHIAARKETKLTKEIAQQFYGDHQENEYFDELADYMSSGPTLFMVLTREGAVDGWRSLIGPTDPAIAKEEAPNSLRALFGTTIKANAVHGSSNLKHAQDAIELVFDVADLCVTEDGLMAQSPTISAEQIVSSENVSTDVVESPSGEQCKAQDQESPHEENSVVVSKSESIQLESSEETPVTGEEMCAREPSATAVDGLSSVPGEGSLPLTEDTGECSTLTENEDVPKDEAHALTDDSIVQEKSAHSLNKKTSAKELNLAVKSGHSLTKTKLAADSSISTKSGHSLSEKRSHAESTVSIKSAHSIAGKRSSQHSTAPVKSVHSLSEKKSDEHSTIIVKSGHSLKENSSSKHSTMLEKSAHSLVEKRSSQNPTNLAKSGHSLKEKRSSQHSTVSEKSRHSLTEKRSSQYSTSPGKSGHSLTDKKSTEHSTEIAKSEHSLNDKKSTDNSTGIAKSGHSLKENRSSQHSTVTAKSANSLAENRSQHSTVPAKSANSLAENRSQHSTVPAKSANSLAENRSADISVVPADESTATNTISGSTEQLPESPEDVPMPEELPAQEGSESVDENDMPMENPKEPLAAEETATPSSEGGCEKAETSVEEKPPPENTTEEASEAAEIPASGTPTTEDVHIGESSVPHADLSVTEEPESAEVPIQIEESLSPDKETEEA